MLGLVGVALGVALGFLGAWLADRRRWKREDDTRWHSARLLAYSRVLGAAFDVIVSSAGLVGLRQAAGEELTAAALQPHLEEHVSKLRELLMALAEGQLFATGDAFARLRELQKQVGAAAVLAEDPAPTEQEWKDVHTKAFRAARQFLLAAREELRIPPPDHPRRGAGGTPVARTASEEEVGEGEPGPDLGV
jgi:hypothetical protein